MSARRIRRSLVSLAVLAGVVAIPNPASRISIQTIRPAVKEVELRVRHALDPLTRRLGHRASKPPINNSH